MTAKDSSSSATSRTDSPAGETSSSRASVDLAQVGLLPPLAAAFAESRSVELLRPLEFLTPGALPRRIESGVDRTRLAEALAVANAAYGHSRAQNLSEKLADPRTSVVVTGQQTGLFGGPLYTLSKAIAAALWAERLEASGRPAVAVFWMATEDHDYAEVARASFPSSRGLLDLDLGEDPTPLMPVGMRVLGDNVEAELDRLREAFPGERFSAWIDRLATWYRPNAGFGEAFARLLVGLLGDRCPLLLDAMLPAVKEAQRPFLDRIVAGHEELVSLYAERDREVLDAGFRLQVEPQPGASPLFYLHQRQRRRLHLDGNKVRLRGLDDFEESSEWLAEAILENPSVVSPGVLARPAMQDAILGTTLQVLGPGEVSYMPQVAPLYEWLGFEAPAIALRPQLLAMGRHELDKLASTGLSVEHLVSAGFDLDKTVGQGRGERLTRQALLDIEARLDRLESEAVSVDRTLEAPVGKTRSRIRGSLEALAGKIDSALARADQVKRGRVKALHEAVSPAGRLQERVVSSSFFPGKYGDGFVEACFEQLELDGRRLSVIELG